MISRLRSFSLFDTGNKDKGRRSRSLMLHLAAVLVLIISAMTTFFAFFPEQLVREQIERLAGQQKDWELTIGRFSFVPPAGLQLTEIGLQPKNPDWPAIAIDNARVSPLWTTLFSGNPGAALQAALSSGTLEGRVMKDGSLEADLAGIVLRPLLPARFAYPPEGTIEGHLEGSQLLVPGKRQAVFDLAIAQLGVDGLESLGVGSGRLALGRVSVRGELQGQTLEIKELRNSDGDVQLEGKGVLLLGSSAALSRISARIDVTPGPGLDPMLRDLLSLSGTKPNKEGAYRFRIAGSLERPVLR